MPKKKIKKASDNGHKRFSPSKSKRWLNCPGSIPLSDTVPAQPTSEFAAEGTAAHELAELCLNNEVDASHYLGKIVNKFEVTEEMAEAVQVYLDIIEEDWDNAADNSDFHVEFKVEMEHIHPELGGTSDAVIDQPRKRLTMYDYKHGKGVDVDAEENPQGMNYILGYAENSEYKYKEFEFVIVQPRLRDEDRRIKRWVFKPGRLAKFKKEVLEAIQRAGYEEPDFASGDWCKFCPCAAICPELHNTSLEIAQADFTPMPETIDLTAAADLTPKQMLLVLNNASIITAWIKSIETHAYNLLTTGRKVSGFKMVRGKANRRWKPGKKVLTKLKKLIDEDELYSEPKLISPAQAEKLIEDKSSISKLWEKPKGKITIAPESDKRPAAPLPAAVDFDD